MIAMLLNGISEVDLNLVPTEAGPAVAGFTRERAATAWFGRTGVLPSSLSKTASRVLRYVYANSRLMTLAQRNAVLQWLSALLTGVIEVQPTDGTQRRLVGVCTVYDASVASPAFVNVAPDIVVEITCYNAALEDIEMLQYVLSTTPVRVPVGTAGHSAMFLITGANSTPFTITYRSFTGAILAQITGTPALLANEQLVIDSGTEQFVRYTATAGVAGVSVPTWNTTQVWPDFLPRHAQRELQAWATLESDVAALVYYRRNWEN